MPDQLPHRFRESAFRRYEQTIHDVMAVWPDVYKCTPVGSTVTFVCRFRDAVNSLLSYGWTTSIDVDKLRSIWQTKADDRMIVSERPAGMVWIGPAYILRPHAIVTAEVLSVVEPPGRNELFIQSPSDDDLRAVLHLCARRLFPVDLQVRVQAGDQGRLTALASGKDVELIVQPDGSTIIL